MMLGTRKRLSFIFSYGGQVRDLEAVLEMIASKNLQPQVETRRLEEFPTVLKELSEGRIRGRVALTQEGF
jgi:alcohol dehydrogenase, propanol-preferring